MSAKARIGITCSPLRVAGYDHPYLRAIASAGADPGIIEPLAHPPDRGETERLSPGSTACSGREAGTHSPDEYGGRPVDDVTQVDPAVDRTEVALVRGAAESGTPVLGICRQANALEPALRATAHGPDDIIEAVESSHGAIVAVQAFPEELIDGHSWARVLFERFVERNANRSRRDRVAPGSS